MKQNDLKERMARGESIYGMFLNSGNSVLTEVIGLAGFDFVLIDSEHGPTDVLKNRELVQAAEYRDVVPIIRVPNSNSDTILKALDIGAHGILVPRVNTAEDAQHIARAAATTPWGCGGLPARVLPITVLHLWCSILAWQTRGTSWQYSVRTWLASPTWIK